MVEGCGFQCLPGPCRHAATRLEECTTTNCFEPRQSKCHGAPCEGHERKDSGRGLRCPCWLICWDSATQGSFVVLLCQVIKPWPHASRTNTPKQLSAPQERVWVFDTRLPTQCTKGVKTAGALNGRVVWCAARCLNLNRFSVGRIRAQPSAGFASKPNWPLFRASGGLAECVSIMFLPSIDNST